jgi:hypothetical protein
MACRPPACLSLQTLVYERGVQPSHEEEMTIICRASFSELSVLNHRRSITVRLEDGSTGTLAGNSASGFRNITTSTLRHPRGPGTRCTASVAA